MHTIQRSEDFNTDTDDLYHNEFMSRYNWSTKNCCLDVDASMFDLLTNVYCIICEFSLLGSFILHLKGRFNNLPFRFYES